MQEAEKYFRQADFSMINLENMLGEKENSVNTSVFRTTWTIAKLLGHSGVNHVRHYRQMSNQVLAKETREIRDLMSEIIMSSLNGWEDDYEQVRSHD